jgi:DNA-directed RNA polymerase subunit beta'
MAFAAGSYLIKSLLPEKTRAKYDQGTILNDKEISSLITLLVRENPEEAHTTLATLAKLFFDKATDQGYSLSLNDYSNSTHEKNRIMSEFEQEVEQILKSSLSKERKIHAINEVVDKVKTKLSKQNIDHLLSEGATSAKMAITGARGNPDQLMQAAASPLLGADTSGRPVPIIVKHSYGQGLTLAEASALSFGSRYNTVMAQKKTALPGDVFKKLTPNVFHEVVTEKDCGTHNGVPYPIEDKKAILHRFQAVTNKLIDDRLYNELKSEGKKEVVVRSTLTCQAHAGVCQLCYGLMADMKLPEIGANVGVIAALSVSEKLTQAMLSTKHTGGLAGKRRSTYEEASNFLKNPDNFQDKAVLATIGGEVTHVEPTELKDHRVYVNGVEHFVPRIQDIIVKKGDHVRGGDALSTGTPNPREVIQHKGIADTRKFYSDKLREIYTGSVANSRKVSSLDARHFDLIAKNMIKYVRILNAGKTGLPEGDYVPVEKLRELLKGDVENVSVAAAEGKTLAKDVGGYPAGEIVTRGVARALREKNVTSVPISHSGVLVEPIVPGLFKAKLLDKNWVSKLSFMNLKQSLLDSTAVGAEAEKHDIDPITPYVIGREFGDGPDGKY